MLSCFIAQDFIFKNACDDMCVVYVCSRSCVWVHMYVCGVHLCEEQQVMLDVCESRSLTEPGVHRLTVLAGW